MNSDLPPNDRSRRRRMLAVFTAMSAAASAFMVSAGGDDTLLSVSAQAGTSPDELLDQLAKLGVKDVTPEHHITQESKAEIESLAGAQPERSAPVLEAAPPSESDILVVQEITEEVLRALSNKPELMYQLQPRKFEELIARLLEEQGCAVTLTKRTRDGGYDIFGRTKTGAANLTFLAECKRYGPENRVGVEIVRGVYGVTEEHRVNYGLIVTTSSFSKDARQETLRIGPRIQLAEYADVCDWLQRAREA